MNIKPLLLFAGLSVLSTAATATQTSFIENHLFINEPAGQSVAVGSTFSIIVQGENFSNGLTGGALDLSFDPSILQVSSVNIDGTFWNFGFNSNGTIDNIAGKIIGTDVAQIGSNTTNTLFDFATYTFNTIGQGVSPLSLYLNSNDQFADNVGHQIAVNLTNNSITAYTLATSVQQVPLPAAFWLFASSILGIVGIQTRKKTASAF